ncbi:MAG: CarD family transcriptional regulator [Firmicutes bacterium]|nr:CarD family transcriptional regulator [Bacillota bacterium]MDD4694146.1 CarD family transcriptional regulator [Bacillota bacterium]
MFSVNDYVIYNSNGVYQIVDICTEKDINHIDTEYYVLKPAFGTNLTIMTPVQNRKVLMREVMTKEDILELISQIPDTETAWIDDARERSTAFKNALRSGEGEKWVKLIKTIYIEQKEKTESGKKLLKTDEEIMKAAEKNLNEEIAIALNIQPDEVPAFISEQIDY